MISRARHKVIKKSRSKNSFPIEMKTVKKSSGGSLPIGHESETADMPFSSAVRRARTLSRRRAKSKKAATITHTDTSFIHEPSDILSPVDSIEEMRKQIEKYNLKSDGSFLVKIVDGQAEGFVPVHLCIEGTVNVMPPTGVGMVWSSLQIVSDILIEDELEMRGKHEIEKVTFENNAKTFVNIDTHTMAFEAIALLIRKLFIVENPADFIFYEVLHGNTRKVKDTELPLVNLIQCVDRSDWKLILKRKPFNDQIGQWAPFTAPELHTFLDMADYEREMKETNVRNLYIEVRRQVTEEIRKREEEIKRREEEIKKRREEIEEELLLVKMRKKSTP